MMVNNNSIGYIDSNSYFHPINTTHVTTGLTLNNSIYTEPTDTVPLFTAALSTNSTNGKFLFY